MTKAKKARVQSRRKGAERSTSTRSRGPRSASSGKTRVLRRSTRRESLPADAALESPAATLRVELALTDVTGKPISDPETFFTFRRLEGNRQLGDQLAVSIGGAPAVFDLPIATGDVLFCEIDARRFRFAQSPVFFGTPGEPIRKETRLFREPRAWQPRFTKWAALSPPFGNLKDVLAMSRQVTIFRELEPIADLLVGDAYDDMTQSDVMLAKTALLNCYFRLSRTLEPMSGRSWFSFVRSIVAIGQERILAFVDPEMVTLVERIHSHIDQFRGDYERTPAGNHRGNVPAPLQPRITGMISIKSTHRRGNFQLTLTRLTAPDEVLLDADIDESGDLLGHFLDLFKHKITGGTHPHDIHELLVLQEGETHGFDLGYRLE